MARISFTSGDVSVKRGDTGEAVAAVTNAPLLAADTIATGPEARAEVQFDSGHRIRLGSEVEARLAEIQDQRFRMELARGTAALSVSRDSRAQAEVSTPNVSMRPLQRGLYRITVGDDGQTTITVRAGEAEIYSEKGTERLSQGQTMTVRGNADDPEFQIAAAIGRDEWDGWNEQRDQALSSAESYRYVNPDIPGAEELDGQGSWVNDPAYGEVWAPRVSPDWAPYRDGRWSWEDYYGWTWVSNDPWGWAPYHYGNWYQGSVGWCWYPGIYSRPVFWRPALVAFFGFGGGGFGVGFGFGGFGNIGWLPLAPFEPFHPWYGRGGFGFGDRRYNVNNVNITNVNITNIYRNARVNGAISGVSANAFTNGQFGAVTPVSAQQVRSAGLVRGMLPIAPTRNNLRFADRTTAVTPTRFGTNSFGGSRLGNGAQSPAATRVPFEQQRQSIRQSTQLYAQSGANRSYPNAQRPAPQAGGSTNSAWARFGTPNRSTGSGMLQTNPARYPAAGSPSQSPGWARFGSPNQAPRAAQPYGSSMARPTGYSGRNVPPPASSPYAQNSQSLRLAQPMVHNRALDQPGYSSPAYNRSPYGGRSGAPAYGSPANRAPSYSSPTYSSPRYSSPSYSSPRYSSPSYSSPGSSPRYSSPSYSSPGSSPRYSSPSYSSPSYRAPSYSSPSYSAPRGPSAPSYSAPSYSAPRGSASPSYSAPRSYSAPAPSPSSSSRPAPSSNSGSSPHHR